MIQVLEQERTFHLKTAHTSLILHAGADGRLMMVHWGSRVDGDAFGYVLGGMGQAHCLSGTDGDMEYKLEQFPVFYPTWGNPDLRNPAFQAVYADGACMTDLRYIGFEISDGAASPEGLPALHGNAETLRLFLSDDARGMEAALCLSVFEKQDAVAMYVRLENTGKETVFVRQAASAGASLLSDQFDAVTLTGAWGRECALTREALRPGRFCIESSRGASGHGQNPFLALAEHETGETQGNVWAMNLIYSGSFSADVSVDMHQNTRMMIGINPFAFSWRLAPGESFCTPQAVLVHTAEGFGGMTRIFHRLYRECLMPERFAHAVRPVLINNWEATYFQFNRKKLLALADDAAALGMELFVLDDGWFGKRDDDKSSLGDWTENQEKLGGSLASLADAIRAKGLSFGLWVEPEMVSPDSTLYRTHPDWIIRDPKHGPQLSRNQYVLDLSRKDVQDWMIDTLEGVLNSAKISYIKWDMNRNITDWYSAGLSAETQGELGHRYMLGLYRVLAALTERHPDVLFESCASGGGRFDAGMLCYMPQTWTSDDTDAIARLDIQAGTSLLYPTIAMGSHVSACPNHMVGRQTPLFTRGVVAMEGNLGYELDLTALSDAEKAEIARQTAFYRQFREVMQFGTFYRLRKDGNSRAWMHVSEDGARAVVGYVRILAEPNTVPKRLLLKGLSPEALYHVERVRSSEEMQAENTQDSGRQQETALTARFGAAPEWISGSTLMHIGIAVPQQNGDFAACQWVVTRK